MQTRRIVGASALGIVVAVGLSGCLKMDMQLELQSDDTVDGTLVFAISSEVADMLGESPETIAEGLREDAFEFEEGTSRSEPYDDGEYVGTTTYFEDQPLSEFDDEESVRIVREGDEFVVSGTFDMTEGAEDGEMMSGLTEDVDMRVSISFPGSVSSHNGTLEGNTVSWQIPYGERVQLEARGSAIEGGDTIPLPLLIGTVVALLIGLGLIVFFVLRRRKGADGASTYAQPGTDSAQPTYAAAATVEAQADQPPPAPSAQTTTQTTTQTTAQTAAQGTTAQPAAEGTTAQPAAEETTEQTPPPPRPAQT